MMRFAMLLGAILVALAGTRAVAQDVDPRHLALVRACAAKYANDVDEAERRCLFRLLATPCAKHQGQFIVSRARDCYDLEGSVWERLLDENLKKLRADLDAEQTKKLDEMQGAWKASQTATCSFYYAKSGGSMSTEMTAACFARETARRALLLRFFQGL